MSKPGKRKGSSALKFVYSYPYELTILRTKGEKLTKEYGKKCRELAKSAQKVWDKYEDKALKLFEEMYKIEVDEKFIEVFVSLAAPNSFSHPMTMALKKFPDIEENERHERAFVGITAHELAHYFAYTRDEDTFFNKLFKKIRGKDLLGERGANLHYLINAVEYAIRGELFGEEHANRMRKYVSENWKGQYKKAAKALIKDEVPLDKTCLEYIEEEILD